LAEQPAKQHARRVAFVLVEAMRRKQEGAP
jgi:hypothetical protein